MITVTFGNEYSTEHETRCCAVPSSPLLPLAPNYLPQHPALKYPQPRLLPQCWTVNLIRLSKVRISNFSPVSLTTQSEDQDRDTCLTLLGEVYGTFILASSYAITECPTRYQTRHFFNNSNTNEDIATKFEQEYVRISPRKSSIWALSNKLETNILISGKIIKEIPGSVASGAPYIKVPYTSPASLVTPFVLKKR